MVDVPVDPRGIADVYLDNTMGHMIDFEGTDVDIRLKIAILLATHVAACQKSSWGADSLTKYDGSGKTSGGSRAGGN